MCVSLFLSISSPLYRLLRYSEFVEAICIAALYSYHPPSGHVASSSTPASPLSSDSSSSDAAQGRMKRSESMWMSPTATTESPTRLKVRQRETETETERQRDRETGRQGDRKTEAENNRQINRQKYYCRIQRRWSGGVLLSTFRFPPSSSFHHFCVFLHQLLPTPVLPTPLYLLHLPPPRSFPRPLP